MTPSVYNPAFAAIARARIAAPPPLLLTRADRIIYRVCRLYGVTRTELAGQSRERRLAVPRHMAIYWLYRLTNLSLQQIGRKFGGRDHATVFRSIDQHVANRVRRGRLLTRPRAKEAAA